MPHISVVTPVYGCRTSLYELYFRLKTTIEKITPDFEIIMVNDASPDGAWETIVEIAEKDPRVKGINFSRNFGQHYAIAAGLDNCNGEWIVVMDCDLQEQPEEIGRIYKKTLEGYDYVLGKRLQKKHSLHKRIFSKLFYRLLSFLTETEQDSSIGNFGIYNIKVINALCLMQDNLKYFPAMVRWVGFKGTSIEIMHAERAHGKTSYSLKKLIHLAINVMLAFSDKPLRLIVKFGFFISLLSIFYAGFNIWKYFNGLIILTGWTSLIFSIWFLSGIIIIILGTIGLYIGKTFEKVKNRPAYIIDQTANINK
jgi:polyisoprenyl-phosphate glycosyltransferase